MDQNVLSNLPISSSTGSSTRHEDLSFGPTTRPTMLKQRPSPLLLLPTDSGSNPTGCNDQQLRELATMAVLKQEVDQLNSTVDQLRTANRGLLAKAEELDRLKPIHLDLFESHGTLLRIVRSYNTVTATCEPCRRGMEFMLTPPHILLGPVPPAEPQANE
jgi:hypothetical protein